MRVGRTLLHLAVNTLRQDQPIPVHKTAPSGVIFPNDVSAAPNAAGQRPRKWRQPVHLLVDNLFLCLSMLERPQKGLRTRAANSSRACVARLTPRM